MVKFKVHKGQTPINSQWGKGHHDRAKPRPALSFSSSSEGSSDHHKPDTFLLSASALSYNVPVNFY